MRNRIQKFFVIVSFFVFNNFMTARAQETAFTYQGQLIDGGFPAHGNYDIMFSLFNVASGGGPLAGPLTNTLAITNGQFTARLDFGSAVFNGTTCWLEISVRTNGNGSFTTLASRQELTATPYAIFAGSAATLGGSPPSSYAATNIASASNNGLMTPNQFLLLSNVITPQMFGAKGDGVTDDTAEMQAALNAGGDIFIPSGNYRVGNLFVTNNTHIRGGNNAWLIQSDSATNYTLSTSLNTNIQIEDLNVSGGLTAIPEAFGTRHGIFMNLGTNGMSWIRDCQINGFNGYGLRVTEPGGVLAGQLYHVGSVDHCFMLNDGCGIFADENGAGDNDSAEYSQWSECQIVGCLIGIDKVAGNVNNVGHRISNCRIGVNLRGPGSNGNHGLWSGVTINHCTTAITMTNNPSGDQFSGCVILADGPVVINNCSGVNFAGCKFGGPQAFICTNSTANYHDFVSGCNFQGSWALQKTAQVNDGALVFLNNFCWNTIGEPVFSDYSFGNPPFVIKPYRYFLGTAQGNTGTYGAGNNGPAPYFDHDWISWTASNGGGFGTYFPSPISNPSTNSIVTITLLNTNTATLWLTNLHGVIEYFGNSGRQYFNPVVYPTVQLPQGYTSISWTNVYTNSVLTREIGVEFEQGNINQNAYMTKLVEQPLQ
jgi:hypothetical protein